jgi:hypothetical protein
MSRYADEPLKYADEPPNFEYAVEIVAADGATVSAFALLSVNTVLPSAPSMCSSAETDEKY